MSSKSLKMSKRKEKKNEQQKDESIDGVNEAYHEGDDDYVTKKYVYDMMKVHPLSMTNNLEFVANFTNQFFFHICFFLKKKKDLKNFLIDSRSVAKFYVFCTLCTQVSN